MKSEEIRKMSVEEMQVKLSDMREELMKLRFQQVTGQLTDTSHLRLLRHDIARMETIFNERTRATVQEGGAMNDRRRITGVVTSNKMTKTVVVEIGRTFRHPLYRKVVHLSKRVKAHDELGCQIGDQVQIVESRPISRDKRWVVELIIKHEIRTADMGLVEVATAPEAAAPEVGESPVEAQP